MAKRILVLHGPNLNLLGEGAWQGLGSLSDLNEMIRARARSGGMEVKLMQSNHEGALVDALHQERSWADGIIVSPSSLAPTGYSLKEAIAILQLPAIEVRIGDRKAGKASSVFSEVCSAVVSGKPQAAYSEAIDKLRGAEIKEAPDVVKTLGRKKSDPEPVRPTASQKSSSGDGRGKTIGPSRKTTPVASKSITRALVSQQIGARLRGDLTPGALATWAREKWLAVERGDAAEAGQREILEEALQQLAVSATGSAKLSDDALIAMMARLA
jgi:3-dehydroquinate dehydratase-2